MTLKQTPLHELHLQHGARMIDFAGWSMPVQYDSALREHLAVRSGAGIFDVSHMGEVEFVGPDALAMVQKITCNDASRLVDGQAQYSALLSMEGTFIDDVVLYRLGAEHFLMCVNAATTQKDLEWIMAAKQGQVQITDRSSQYAQLAIQGSAAEGILQPLTAIDLSAIGFYRFDIGTVCGAEAIVSRTGYTGEDGFEVYLPPAETPRFWRELFASGGESGLRPAGLAARNTLRLEMRYPLYGNDIGDEVTPLEAGLGWIVKLDKGPFLGRDSLLQLKDSGVEQKLVGFELKVPGIARDADTVSIDGEEVGPVTSGSYSPSLEKSIGLTYLPATHAALGQPLTIEVRGRGRKAEVVKTPFYERAD